MKTDIKRRYPGHCLHPPKCIGEGPPDERDPFGCCNCGTRAGEENRASLEEARKALNSVQARMPKARR